METTRLLLTLSTAAFIGAVVQAVLALRAGQWRESNWHLAPMALGFIFQCAFLYLRGQEHGRCPLTNQFEIFIFIGWSIMLLYFLVGAAYRLSLLGVFTAPLLAILQTLALLSPLDQTTAPARGAVNAWKELHASVALIGYAAFALACITGVMFLLQDRLLKRHRINALFHQLPPIHDLAKAITRMMLLGVVLLSIALAASFQIKIPITNIKMLFAWGVWALYIINLLLMWRRQISARQTAWLAIGSFAVVFVSIWMIAK
ncbi:MAG: cytochrome c biogenesis protein CcsA [Verrucomicrobia bacterium]|nr:cytochrome c biogenesis protein CcsA [Verrucomicrobiota bacterium]